MKGVGVKDKVDQILKLRQKHRHRLHSQPTVVAVACMLHTLLDGGAQNGRRQWWQGYSLCFSIPWRRINSLVFLDDLRGPTHRTQRHARTMDIYGDLMPRGREGWSSI